MAALTTLCIVTILVKFVIGQVNGGNPSLTVNQGTEAKEGMFPSVGYVFLMNYKGATIRCGATLIDSEWAVSAAHCFCDKDTGEPQTFLHANVIFGDVDYTIRSDGNQESSFDYIIHDEFNISNLQNDIALLHLKQNLKATEYVKPQKLSTSSTKADPYKSCQVAGWGNKNEDVGTTKLLFANLSITANTECKRAWPNFNESTMLCAGSYESDACVSDSGGPLYCNGELVGIASSGISICKWSTTGVYTKVSAYNKWVQSKTRNLLALWIILTCVVVVTVFIAFVVLVTVIYKRRQTKQNAHESVRAGPNPSEYTRIA